MRYLTHALTIAVTLAIFSTGCGDKRSRAQEWVASAPEKTILGVSCHLGWALETPEFRNLIAKHPIFEQTLEIFLDSAKIDPASETGRASIYITDWPVALAAQPVPAPILRDAADAMPKDRRISDPHLLRESANVLRGMFIQMSGFKDPKAIHQVLTKTFVPQGSLTMNGQQQTLFAILDINEFRIRAIFDGNEKLWIGELDALQQLAKMRSIGVNGQVSRASEWISPGGSVQGFLQPEFINKGALKILVGDESKHLEKIFPKGIKGLAWSFTSPKDDVQLIDMDLCATGTVEAVANFKPIVQRLVAAASTVASDSGAKPSVIQENSRVGFRCQFKRDQLEKALNAMDIGTIISAPPATELPMATK